MPHGRLAELTRGIAQLLYPNSCLLCESPEREAAPFQHGFCASCHESLTAVAAEVCPRCAATVGPHSDVANGCYACRDRSFSFTGAVRLGPYKGPLKEAILRMKTSAGESLAEMLARLFVEECVAKLRPLGIQYVVPVPLHWRRRWARGFNSSATIAEELARELGVKLAPHALRRVKPATQHAQPSATARMENIRGAFACSPRARFELGTVLLVDDVMTTGSTANEAARMLKTAGAGAVFAAILARA